MPKIEELLLLGQKTLNKTSESPALDSEVLLSFILKKPKSYLLSRPEKKIVSIKAKKFLKLLRKRVQSVPVAYLIGYKDFYNRRFAVNQSTLIPRPETEGLIELTMKHAEWNTGQKKKILDMGTGSGNIVITLAKELKHKIPNLNFQFYASDISGAALKVAKANAKDHKVKITFLKSNLAENIAEKFDIVVANLPYVTKKNWLSRRKNLKFEPASALTDGTNQWHIIKRFFVEISKILKNNFYLFLEIDPRSKNLLKKSAMQHLRPDLIEFVKDLSGKTRYMLIKNDIDGSLT